MRIATWNINSVRLRMDLLQRLIDEADPDVICLQETKCVDRSFRTNPWKSAVSCTTMCTG
jgi:exodeoxyribonuclease-3